jgi:hypothetical protein
MWPLTTGRFGIPRHCCYHWRSANKERGEEGLINKKRCPFNVTFRTPIEVEEKVAQPRRAYHFARSASSGTWSATTASAPPAARRPLAPPGQLPRALDRQPALRDAGPGHYVQVDVKYLQVKIANGRTHKRCQFTAIDDAARIRALLICERHNRESVIALIDEVVALQDSILRSSRAESSAPPVRPPC